jgi:hypothetical protein
MSSARQVKVEVEVVRRIFSGSGWLPGRALP